MCLLAFAWEAHPRWQLLLLSNRDEFYPRPTAALTRWSDFPLIAGRDLEASGTWLGVASERRCAVVTNVLNVHDKYQGLSRGLLVRDYLTADVTTVTHMQGLQATAEKFSPFNLLAFDADDAFYISNRPYVMMQRVPSGVHSLSNAHLNTSWPKTRALTFSLKHWLGSGAAADDFTPLFEALADERQAADDELPDTGVGLERERILSPIFIRGEEYGTRASTVVALGYHGEGWIVERRFGVHGSYMGETCMPVT